LCSLLPFPPTARARVCVRENERRKSKCVCSPQHTFKCKLSDDSNSYTSWHLCDRRETERERERESTAIKYTSRIAGNFPLFPQEMTQCVLFTKPFSYWRSRCSGLLCAWVIASRRFGWTYRLHPKGYECYNSLVTLRMKAVLFFKTSRRNYRCTRRINPPDLLPQQLRRGYLKSLFSCCWEYIHFYFIFLVYLFF
jgi:hypothetical protein